MSRVNTLKQNDIFGVVNINDCLIIISLDQNQFQVLTSVLPIPTTNHYYVLRNNR